MKILILAGGKGTKLWPLSRESFPKQFLLLGEKSLFRQTLERCLLVCQPRDIFISTNNNYYFYVKEGLKGTGIKEKNIIVEPLAKNTGPAILFALKELKERFKTKNDEIIFVYPSDHFISSSRKFAKFIKRAEKIAKIGNIVTFGIKPTAPETGYGYIGTKKSLNTQKRRTSHYLVEDFVEKPKKSKAKEFLKAGNYFWNSGMFMFPLELMIEEFKLRAPKIFENIVNSEDNFEKIESIPVDKAVIEKSDKVVVIAVDFQWSDIGSWDTFHQIQEKDGKGNVVIGNVLTYDTENSLILGDHRLVACIGLKDLMVVETNDAVFVAPKRKAQEVKKLVEELKKRNKREAWEGLKIYRPWGSYTICGEGENYKIKKVVVNPKEKLSLQFHNHRSEHWVVVKGEAKVIIGKKQFFLKKGESTFVPQKTKHRLENPTKKILEIIEVQNGDYLGEDDIVRFDDKYKRDISLF